MLIPLFKHSNEVYNSNKLIIIAIIYQIYIEGEWYNLAYGENQGWVYKIEV